MAETSVGSCFCLKGNHMTENLSGLSLRRHDEAWPAFGRSADVAMQDPLFCTSVIFDQN